MKPKHRRGANSGRVFDVRRAFPGKIRPNRRKVGVWQEMDGEVYMTCFSCGVINKITGHKVYVSGQLLNCVTCTHCKGHFFTRLMGWKGPIYARCDHCGRKKYGKIKTRAKDFRGWVLDWDYGVECPQCR